MSDPFGFGSDLACMPDLDPRMTEVEGSDVLVQDLVHRLDTPRGRLVDDRDYGTDATAVVSEGYTPEELRAVPRTFEAELRKDDRVGRVVSTVTQVSTSDGVTLEASFDVVTAAGPFRFTTAIDQALVLVKESKV